MGHFITTPLAHAQTVIGRQHLHAMEKTIQPSETSSETPILTVGGEERDEAVAKPEEEEEDFGGGTTSTPAVPINDIQIQCQKKLQSTTLK